MFVLEVTTGPSKGQAIALDYGKTLVIGRASGCHLHFEDPELSAAHAEVSWTDDGFAVKDLLSRNGTLVNGVKIDGRAGLRLGDFIQAGAVILQLREAAAGMEVTKVLPAPASPEGMLAFDAAETRVMRRVVPQPQEDLRRSGGILAQSAQRTAMAPLPTAGVTDEQVRAAADLARLVTGNECAGTKVIVSINGRLDPFPSLPVTIGRETSSGIFLEDEATSLRHAVIDERDGTYVVRDVGSSNGTFVNGQRVVMRKLDNGDIVSIGRYTMLVVLGPRCLGLEVRTPVIAGENPRGETQASVLAVVDRPLTTTQGKKKPKKKAAELVWFATSDLDRGGYRAKSAVVALMVGIGFTGWILSSGDSEVLAGGALMNVHEGEKFTAKATELGRSSCTSCHIGVGKVSSLKCYDCHQENRPADYHAEASLDCRSCHGEHRGESFRAAAGAVLGCMGCHDTPHTRLIRSNPKLVEDFRPDAPADVAFHLRHHTERDVACTTCHSPELERSAKGARSACGQCHAPDLVTAQDCQQCHREHPDREVEVVATGTGEDMPPRFRLQSLPWVLALVLAPFLIAALMPRRREKKQEEDPAEAK